MVLRFDDARVDDLVQPPAAFGVCKNDGAKIHTIYRVVRAENALAKLFNQIEVGALVWLHHRMRHLVGIEDDAAYLAEHRYDEALADGDPTRHSDRQQSAES